MNSFCGVQQFTNGNGLFEPDNLKLLQRNQVGAFLEQLQQRLMGHYQSDVTMWYLSGPYDSLQCSSDVRLE